MVSREKSLLLWRCRRGTREMDLLLQQFVDQRYDSLAPEARTAFKNLLDQSDPDIMDWIMGKTEPPTEDLKQLIDMIRTTDIRNPS